MKQIVKEPVVRVPHLVMVFPNSIHGVCDPDEMFKEAEGNILIHGVVLREYEGNLQHVLAVEGHPCCTIGLVEMATSWELSAAIEQPNIVQPEKPSGKDILSLRILPVDPPVKVQHQSLKRPFEEPHISPPQFVFDVVQE